MPDVQDKQSISIGWTRKTPWRQGSVIPSEIAVKLGLIDLDELDTAAVVVISHDCDLANDNVEAEPWVEVIVGRSIDEINGNFTAAKSTRTLHLEIIDAQAPSRIEIMATRKASLPKEKLATLEPSQKLAVTGQNLQTLQAWLAARYRRAAFPDELVNRLKLVEDVFAKAVKPLTDEILGIFIDYEPEEELLDQKTLYSLYLSVVYSTERAGAEEKAKTVVQRLNDTFENHFKRDGMWQRIELRGCSALSDTEFTLRDVLQTKQYRLEHLSFRRDPPGPVAEVL